MQNTIAEDDDEEIQYMLSAECSVQAIKEGLDRSDGIRRDAM